MGEGDKIYSLRIGTDPLFTPLSTLFTDVDTKNRILMVISFILGLCALFHIQAINGHADDFFCEAFATYGATSLTIDVLYIAAFMFIFVGFDFWSMGFSIYSYIMFIFFSTFAASAVTIPWYFGMRVSRSCKIKASLLRNGNDENGEENDNNKASSECNFKAFIPVIIYVVLLFWMFLGWDFSPFPKPSLCNPFKD